MAIKIFSNEILKEQKNIWNHILFHPTDAIEDDWGQKILTEIANDKAAKVVRIYAMLEDIVSMDEKGNLKYDFALNDLRLDFLLKHGFTPMIAYGGTPACLAVDPSETNSISNGKTRYKGKMWITSPIKDYALWEEVCYTYTQHIVSRYGEKEVEKWYLQCFNEADIAWFFMQGATVKERFIEYSKMYLGFERGTMKACKNLRIGGPALAVEYDFLNWFLEYVKENSLTLKYVSVHNYGTKPELIESGERPFCVDHQFEKYDKIVSIIKKYYPEGMEIVQDEWGASGMGFVQSNEFPSLLFRETEKFAVYYTLMLTRFVKEYDKVDNFLICLSGQHEMKGEFEGFRNFFSLHFIKKPIYNAYVLAGKLKEYVLKEDNPHLNLQIMPTKDKAGKIAILLTYASSNFREDLPILQDDIIVENIIGNKKITQYIIDKNNTNAYTVFKEKGWQEPLNNEQIDYLKSVATLKGESKQIKANGSIKLPIKMQSNSVILLEIE